MSRTRLPALLAATSLLLAACSGSSGAASTPPPLVTPRAAAPGGTVLGVGPVAVTVPASMTRVDTLQATKGQQVGGYRSAPGPDGRAGAVLVTVAGTAPRSPRAEGEALVGQKRDVQRATGVSMTPVSFPGLTDAVAVEYDDAPSAQGAASPLHGLVVIAKGPSGQLVNVTAVAPPALFASLDLTGAVASLRVPGATG